MILLWFNETDVEKDSVREIIAARPNRMLITARSDDDGELLIVAGFVVSMFGVPIMQMFFSRALVDFKTLR